MKENLMNLRKRTFGDLVISLILTAGVLLMAVSLIVEYFSAKKAEFLTDGICSFAIFLELGLMSLILLDIRKNGQPFRKQVITKLRIMGVTLTLCGFVPSMTTVTIDLEQNIEGINVTFGMQNFLIILLGITVCIISEIFVYGKGLQEDNDLIA